MDWLVALLMTREGKTAEQVEAEIAEEAEKWSYQAAFGALALCDPTEAENKIVVLFREMAEQLAQERLSLPSGLGEMIETSYHNELRSAE